MTQEIIIRSSELTVQRGQSTLNKEQSIFMPDAGVQTEGIQPARPVIRADISPLPRVSTGLSLEGLTPAQKADALRTARLLQGFGLKPDQVTSKGRVEQKAGQVVENSQLDSDNPKVLAKSQEILGKGELTDQDRSELFGLNAKRIAKAEELLKERLGRELTDKEKEGILRAHFVGAGEKGKNGEESGVFNVTREQLAEKAKILKDAGFDQEQRREIIESGLTQMNQPTLTPLEARNQAILALANLPLTGKLLEIRDNILALHNAAIGNPAAGIPAINPDGISSDAFTALHREFYNKFNKVLLDPNTPPPPDVLLFESRLKNISDLDARTHEQRGPQENFSNEYDFLLQQLSTTPQVLPNGALNPQRGILEEELVRSVEDFVGHGINPSSDSIYDSTLKRIVQTDTLVGNPELQARIQSSVERLVIRIVGMPLQDDVGDFDIGFYGGINFSAIKNLLYSQSLDSAYFRNQQEYNAFRNTRRDQNLSVEGLYHSMRIVHEINKMIVQNQLDAANQSAPNLGPEALQMLAKTKGAGAIFRIMESGLLELLAKDGYMAKGSYDALMGKAMSQRTGRYDNSQTSSITSQVREMIDALRLLPPAIIQTGDLQELRDMEGWEIDLAFNLGRNMYNVLHRSAELASWGRLPKGLKLYTNSVFGGFRNIYNPALHVIERFKPGEGRGGYRLFQMFMDAMQRRREREGYGHMGLKKLHGDLIKYFELPSIAGMRGYVSSWKANEGVLKVIETSYVPRGKFADLNIFSQVQLREAGSQIFDRNGGVIAGKGIGYFLDVDALTFKDNQGKTFTWKDFSDDEKADYYRSIFFEPNTGGHGHEPVLKRDINIGLGTLYKTALGPAGGHAAHDNHYLNEVKEEIRRLIWERVGEDNPLAVLPYLHRLEFSEDHRAVDLGHHGAPHLVDVAGTKLLEDIYDRPGWQAFQVKLMLLNEWRMSKIKQGNPNYTLQDAISEMDTAMGVQRDPVTHAITQGGNQSLNLSGDEYAWYQEIARGAKLASADMANVRFGFVAFANDLPLEQFNFEVLGDNSYQRHFGDIVQINSSTGAMIEAFDNLGTVKDYHGIVEIVSKFEKGITAVHGDNTAKDKAAPLVEAITRFFRRGENGGSKNHKDEDEKSFTERAKRYFRQWDEVHGLLQQFHKANSIAQQFYNVEALALDRHQLYMLQEELMANGLMGHDQEEEFRERFGGFLGFINRMFIEQFSRLLKVTSLITARNLLGSSFKGIGQ